MPTIDESIWIINSFITPYHDLEINKSLQLGIEALKRVKDNRTHCHLLVYQPLPGESEEVEGKADLEMIKED